MINLPVSKVNLKTLKEVSSAHIIKTLKLCNYSVPLTAHVLEIASPTLYKFIARQGNLEINSTRVNKAVKDLKKLEISKQIKPLGDILDLHFQRVMVSVNRNNKEAAEILGVSAATMYYVKSGEKTLVRVNQKV